MALPGSTTAPGSTVMKPSRPGNGARMVRLPRAVRAWLASASAVRRAARRSSSCASATTLRPASSCVRSNCSRASSALASAARSSARSRSSSNRTMTSPLSTKLPSPAGISTTRPDTSLVTVIPLRARTSPTVATASCAVPRTTGSTTTGVARSSSCPARSPAAPGPR
jgi:hypothetical protein